jgi:hypothetical protein
MSGAEAYSRLDRTLHRLAFAGLGVQKALADLEEHALADRLEPVAPKRPVFITSLPRAGTTLLLEALSALPEFASHTYRDMPFVLCPLLWDRLSRAFRKEAALRERAHGDGMAIGYDSAEAFEEIIWRAFWGKKYRPDRIEPWSSADRDPEFELFFRNHLRKIVALRGARDGAGRPGRYLSKNNANIARLELLRTLFPDCRIVIPIRHPLRQIRSLRRQHERFTAIHARDRFSLRYMEWLGHFEFGAALRPIDFGGWMGQGAGLDPFAEPFWLTYWAEAYEAVLAAAGANVRFFDYDRACAHPEPEMAALAGALDLEAPSELLAQAARFRRPTRDEAEHLPDTAPGARVRDVYEALKARSA